MGKRTAPTTAERFSRKNICAWQNSYLIYYNMSKLMWIYHIMSSSQVDFPIVSSVSMDLGHHEQNSYRSGTASEL